MYFGGTICIIFAHGKTQLVASITLECRTRTHVLWKYNLHCFHYRKTQSWPRILIPESTTWCSHPDLVQSIGPIYPSSSNMNLLDFCKNSYTERSEDYWRIRFQSCSAIRLPAPASPIRIQPFSLIWASCPESDNVAFICLANSLQLAFRIICKKQVIKKAPSDLHRPKKVEDKFAKFLRSSVNDHYNHPLKVPSHAGGRKIIRGNYEYILTLTDFPSSRDCASAKEAVNWGPWPGILKTGFPCPTCMFKMKVMVHENQSRSN